VTAGREQAVREAAGAIEARLGGRRPRVAITLGSGLGAFAERVRDAVRIPYAEIPHFPPPTVIGHAGELVAGLLGKVLVLVQSGRFHLYEGHDAATSALAVRAFATLGVETLILTNAAGGIRRGFGAGTVMMIADHVNLSFRNPLTGATLPGEVRFPDMSDPYDPGLRALARDVARRERVALAEGVYVQLLGPSYETPAEIRMLERLGGDAVGMSTAVEVIAARARGMRCLALSAVTNAASGVLPVMLSHEEVMENARRVSGDLAAIIEGVVAAL
jgi:purine-nucleoside phosphorylase